MIWVTLICILRCYLVLFKYIVIIQLEELLSSPTGCLLISLHIKPDRVKTQMIYYSLFLQSSFLSWKSFSQNWLWRERIHHQDEKKCTHTCAALHNITQTEFNHFCHFCCNVSCIQGILRRLVFEVYFHKRPAFYVCWLKWIGSEMW